MTCLAPQEFTRHSRFTGDDYADILTREGWLTRTPADFQSAVISGCIPTRRAAGEPLYQIGDAPGGLFGICSGALEISTPLGDPDADVLHLAQPGFWFGAGPALTGEPRRMRVGVRTDTVLAHLPLTALNRIMANRPEWWRHVGALAIENMDVVIGAAADLLIRDNRRRCVAVLLRLCGARYADPCSDASLDLAVSQTELASMAHLSRNGAGAVLRQLARCDLIDLGYRTITVRAPAAMRAIVAEAALD